MVAEEARRRGNAQVVAVHLRLGPLSGVAKEALLSSYQLACEGTLLDRSRLLIEETVVAVFCPTCQTERPLASIRWFCCPVCNSPASEVLRGKELEVVAMEIQ
jgi:hydrogenase nickel incorporation protein HypA/HybF